MAKSETKTIPGGSHNTRSHSMRRFLALLSVISFSVLVWGCATMPVQEMGWYKPGCGQAELDRDRYNCKLQAQQSVSEFNRYGGYTTVKTNYPLVKECLEANGWKLVPK